MAGFFEKVASRNDVLWAPAHARDNFPRPFDEFEMSRQYGSRSSSTTCLVHSGAPGRPGIDCCGPTLRQ